MNLDELAYVLPAEFKTHGAVDDYRLLILYAYNAYFNADNLNTEEVINGITYDRSSKYSIDGVFINETLEENTIEILYSYYVGNQTFNLTHVFNVLNYVSTIVEDVVKRKFFNNNAKAEALISEYLADSDNKGIIIRIITDYNPDENEKYEISKKIEQFIINISTVRISATISYGDDIVAAIDANIAPYEWVENDKLVVDNPSNILKFGENSIVCNVSALSLKKLWKKEGNRGLLSMNLRYYIKAASIDSKIEDSLLFDSENFWYLNNGIIIVCNDFRIIGNELRLDQFSIVNGGQTSRMIGTIPFNRDFSLLCKVIKNTFETNNEKNTFISKVAEASNTQKPIKPKDIIANRIEQRNLKSMMQENGVFIEIKRGEKYNRSSYKEPFQKTKNNEIAQDLYSFVYMEPGPARNKVSSILQNEEKYKTIFVSHKYSFDFLRDLLFVEKAYKEYNKKIAKAVDENPIKKGLVRNGLHYCIAIIGYLLKFKYNQEFVGSIYKYRNNDAMFPIYSSELAFSHGFVTSGMEYKTFANAAFDLFDFIFSNLIIVEFEVAKSFNESIAYSNWLKTNTGFNLIQKRINVNLLDNKDDSLLKYVSKFFANVSDEQMNKNIDDYVDYCKKNKKIKAKDLTGNIMDEQSELLRNELMLFRLKKSTDNHILESKIFTDKMLDKIVYEKPVVIQELKKIIGAESCYYSGKDIINIIVKYI